MSLSDYLLNIFMLVAGNITIIVAGNIIIIIVAELGKHEAASNATTILPPVPTAEAIKSKKG